MPKNIERDELHKMVTEGSATVVEALPREYYDQGHLPGALHMPHDQVDELAPQLLTDKSAPVVVYCANAACKNSSIAATRLEELGYTNVYAYEEGKAGWSEAGLPVETGAGVSS